MAINEIELQRINQDFETADPYSVLRWATQTFGEKLTVVTSFQPTGIVTLHMLSEIAPATSVLTLDTGVLFPETYALIETLEQRLNLNLTRVRPRQTVREQAEDYGDELWKANPDLCCQLRKVEPLGPALESYDAWITGLRRDQHNRTNTPIVSWDKKYNKVKLSPFANWDEEMIWVYIEAHELPYNALHDMGYASIGCNTPYCTAPTNENDNERSGRWVHRTKTECGLHTATA